ncbi:MAG: LCP family protein [Cyanobacteriota bacterium]
MQETRISKKKNVELTFGWWLLTIFTSFIISAAIIWIIHIIWHPSIKEITGNLSDSINIFKAGTGSPALPSIKKKMTILAMGVDSNGRGTDPFKGTRTDTMIVAIFDPVQKTINGLSIPRDSKVYLADNRGVDKINAAHAYGGPELAVKTVEQTLGIKIDHYVIIDYAGFKEVVKALGGVDVFVEKRMKYTDHSGKLYIDLQPGKQHLDAEHAEGYLRFRHDAEGDIGRIKRQQWFMKAILEKLKEPATVFKLPQLIELSQKYVKTDMSLTTMLKLGGFTKDIDLNKIQIATIPGTPSMYSRVSYWLIDVDRAQILVDRLVYGFEESNISNNSKEEAITVSILYSPEKKELIETLKETLEGANYKVVCKNTTKEVHTKIISHSSRATLETTNQLRYDLSELENAPAFLSPKEVYCAPSDYTIVLGNDT